MSPGHVSCGIGMVSGTVGWLVCTIVLCIIKWICVRALIKDSTGIIVLSQVQPYVLRTTHHYRTILLDIRLRLKSTATGMQFTLTRPQMVNSQYISINERMLGKLWIPPFDGRLPSDFDRRLHPLGQNP